MTMKRIVEGLGTYLHPLLFAAFAGLSLQANNLRAVGLSGGRGILLSIAFALGVYLVAWWLVRDRVIASLVASGFVLVFFSYGHVVEAVESVVRNLDEMIIGWLILTLLLFLLTGWLYFLFRVVDQPRRVAHLLTGVGLILTFYPSYKILTATAEERRISPNAKGFLSWAYAGDELPVLGEREDRGSADLPDIYYIVVDAYSRSDVLQDVYGYDNSEFLKSLEGLGFEIVERAHSNYPTTVYSIASSLNMIHLNGIPEYLQEEELPRGMGAVDTLAYQLVRHSEVREALQGLGYEFVSFDSGYGATRIRDADRFIASQEIQDVGLAQFGFEMMLLDTTIGKQLINLMGEDGSPHNRVLEAHRARIDFALRELPGVADWQGDYFVFAHVISPHVPFVFGPNGEPLKSDDPFTLLRPERMDATVKKRYRDQVHYLNTLLLDAIADIMAGSEEPPIILLQSDHGSRLSDDVDLSAVEDMDLYFPILYAAYVPGGNAAVLDEHPSPVNLFRYVFNTEFGAGLDYLPDSSFFPTTRDGRALFLDVCQEFGICY